MSLTIDSTLLFHYKCIYIKYIHNVVVHLLTDGVLNLIRYGKSKRAVMQVRLGDDLNQKFQRYWNSVYGRGFAQLDWLYFFHCRLVRDRATNSSLGSYLMGSTTESQIQNHQYRHSLFWFGSVAHP